MSFNDILESINEEIDNEEVEPKPDTDTKEELDTEEVEPKSILKPKRGRKPLSDKQKKALEKGRRNHQLRMAKKKIQEIEQQQLKEEEERIATQPKPKPKPKKKTVIYEDSSDDDEEKVVIVKRKKKKKPKKKIVYESETSSDDESDIEPRGEALLSRRDQPQPITRQERQYTQPPQPPPFRHPLNTYRGGLFR
jgi:hypothetical protein